MPNPFEQGAQIGFGGAEIAHLAGNCFEPTLVECPSPSIETLKAEMFAPIMSLVPFDTEEEEQEILYISLV